MPEALFASNAELVRRFEAAEARVFPLAMVDPDRLAQILSYLIENSLIYARSAVTVGLSAAELSEFMLEMLFGFG